MCQALSAEVRRLTSEVRAQALCSGFEGFSGLQRQVWEQCLDLLALREEVKTLSLTTYTSRKSFSISESKLDTLSRPERLSPQAPSLQSKASLNTKD